MPSTVRYPDSMDTQSPWRNRRVQRSAICAILLLIFIWCGLYFRAGLTDIRLDTIGESTFYNPFSEPDTSIPPPSHDPFKEPPESPIIPTDKQPVTKPASKNGKPASKNGKPASKNGKPVSKNGKPAKTSVAKAGKTREPLHPTDSAEYDLNNMPKIPESKSGKLQSVNKIELDPSRIALIIETRPLPHIPALLSSFIATVPYKWGVKVAGTKEVFTLIRASASLRAHVNSGKLALVDLPSEYPVEDQEAISGTLTNLKFYSEFLKPAEWVLMFQTDSIICSASDQSLDDWVAKNYSWVGAPWFPDIKGGNGGLSLRHLPSIITVLQNETRTPGHEQWEDLWLSSRLANSAMGDVELAFSVESQYYERPLGYHLRGSGRWLDGSIWGNMTRKRQILSYCPEVKIILGNMALQPGNDEDMRLLEIEADKRKAEEDAIVAEEAAKKEKADKSKESDTAASPTPLGTANTAPQETASSTTLGASNAVPV